MSYNYSTTNLASRPTGGSRTVQRAPAAVAAMEDADCLSGIYLPSTFQTGSWLLDHCQETAFEPTACQPTCFQASPCIVSPNQATCSRPVTCVSSPCSTPCNRPLTFVSSGCKPLGGISGVCQPVGGISTGVCQPVGGISNICQPACGASRGYQRSFVSSCRRTC
ncbi:keratin-associated protein 11-1 isoform X2 [Echinops telfairi]|uniref:Keratin-associated protein n=1 Tax=Echinops telfairi TaxID=9371 RepID=A0ABM0ZSL6_ECHTE|nr:keratin-associated protein 11-1 isoform X2 [Echinops telfairi]